MFRNDAELKEALDILSAQYEDCFAVYQEFTIENKTITFIGDTYHDPVLTLSALRSYGIIDAKVDDYSHEMDKVTILDVNLQALNHLRLSWPTWKNVHELVPKLGYSQLKEGEVISAVDNKSWQSYKWLQKNRPNSLKMPTVEEILRTLSIFSYKAESTQKKEQLPRKLSI